MAYRFREIRPRARKMAFLSPSERAACVKGYLRLFFSYRVYSFARLRRQAFITLGDGRWSERNIHVHF